MLLTLIKTYLLGIKNMMFTGNRSNKKRTPAMKFLIFAGVVFIVADLLFALGSTFVQVGQVFCAGGRNELYFGCVGILTLIIGIFGGIMSAYTMLYESKDTDLILSMPVPRSYVLAMRFSAVIVLDYFYSVFAMIPAVVVYFMFNAAGVRPVILCVLSNLLLPLVSITFCCAFALVIALLSSGRKLKKTIQYIFSILFLALYLFFIGKSGNFVEVISSNASKLAYISQSVLLPVKYYCFASTGSLTSFALFAAWVFIPLAIVLLLISLSFFRIITRSEPAKKSRYISGKLESSGVHVAIMKKEIAQFFSNPNYLLNCGLGGVMAVVASVTFLVKKEEFVGSLAQSVPIPNIGVIMVAVMIVFCAFMINTSTVSLSLEGKFLPVLKSMPLSAEDIIFPKILANFVIGLPLIFTASVISAIAVSGSILTGVSLVFFSVSMLVLSSVCGGAVNLRFPRTEFTNPIYVIKQSPAVLVEILIALAASVVTFGSYAGVLSDFVPAGAFLAIMGVIALIVAYILYRTVIVKRGDRTLLSIS